jgi:capsular polysaccharide biosynthesis protein
MELRRYLRLLRQRILLILVTTIVGAAAGYLASPRQAVYQTQAELYVGSLQVGLQQLYAQNQVGIIAASYAEMIPSAVIAQKALALTGAPRTAGQVISETKAAVIPDTSLLVVTVRDPNPVVAQELANGMSTAFVDQIQSDRPGTQAQVGTVPTEPAYVFQDAYLPSAPLSTSAKRNAILGGVLGLVASSLFVLLLDYLDITVKDPADLERRLGVPVLGVVPRLRVPLRRPDVA